MRFVYCCGVIQLDLVLVLVQKRTYVKDINMSSLFQLF